MGLLVAIRRLMAAAALGIAARQEALALDYGRSALVAAWPLELSVTALIVGVIAMLWRHRERRRQMERTALEAVVEDRTRELSEIRQTAESARRESSSLIEEISAGMRAPIDGVIELSQLALEVADQPEASRRLRVLQTSARGLLSLMDEASDFTGGRLNHLEMAPAAFELRSFVHEVCSMMDKEAARQGVTLDCVVDDAVSDWVRGDEARLRQVLLNLIGSAVRSTAGGAVTLGVEPAGMQLQFIVAGDSETAPPGASQTAGQADQSTGDSPAASPAPLLLSSRLVKALGGELWVRSEPGKGAVFSFAIDAPPAAPPEAEEVDGFDGLTRPMKILLATGAAQDHDSIEALLRDRGHYVSAARNGLEALAALEEGPFNLVLLDTAMPVLDGLETVRKIREVEQRSGAHVPAIALMREPLAIGESELLTAGMDDFIAMPVQPERLDALLMRFAGPFGLNTGERG